MGWSYGGDPTTSLVDAVRAKVGDTDPDEQLIADEVILYLLDQHGDNVARAAVDVMWAIAARLFRNVSKAVGPLRIEKQQQYDHAVQLAERLETEASASKIAVAPVFAGTPDPTPYFTRGRYLDRPATPEIA